MRLADSGGTRASLLSRAKRQDSRAWSELVDLYAPLIAHWCYRCGFDSHSAADCVQDVFAAVHKALSRYQPIYQTGSFRAWLWTIASNKIRDAVRNKKNNPRAPGGSTAMQALNQVCDLDSIPDAEPTDADQLSSLIRRGLEQVSREIEPRTIAIFRRSVVDQIATPIVAEEFGITPAAVRQIRSRTLRRLRQQLGDME